MTDNRASKTTKKIGRPTVITPAVAERLLTIVTGGATVRETCRRLGIHYSTVARKEIEDPAFAAILARARVVAAAYCIDEGEDELRKAKDSTEIMRARELAIHLRWKASKLLPQYSDRLGVQADVSIEHTEDRNILLLETARMVAFIMDEAAKLTSPPKPEGVLLLAAPADRRQETLVQEAGPDFDTATVAAPTSGDNETVRQQEESERDPGLALSRRAEESAIQGRARRQQTAATGRRTPFTARNRQ